MPEGLSMTRKCLSSKMTASADLGHLAAGRPLRLRPLRDPHRRNAQHVAVSETRIRLGPLAVHPHLPGAQNPVDHALGHPLEHGHQGVVDALAIPLGADLDLTHTLRCVGGSYRLH